MVQIWFEFSAAAIGSCVPVGFVLCWFQVRMTCRAFTTDLAAFFSCWVVLAVLSHFPVKVLGHDLLNMPSSSLSPFKYLHLGLVTVDVALLSHFRHFFSRLFFWPSDCDDLGLLSAFSRSLTFIKDVVL